MSGRLVSIWFHHLTTDWFSIRQPQLRQQPFVLKTSSHGRMVITAANTKAEMEGIRRGMVLADAKAVVPDLQVLDDIRDLPERLLTRLASWCIRFSPVVAIDPPEGLILEAIQVRPLKALLRQAAGQVLLLLGPEARHRS
jgi:protein ImuB